MRHSLVLFLSVIFTVQCNGENDPAASLSTKLAQLLNLKPLPPGTSVDDLPDVPAALRDPKHGVVMGVPSDKCDNGKDNLSQDWNGSPVNYTCFSSKFPFPVGNAEPVISCDSLPSANYSPPHYCMDTPVHYTSPIPTFEGHRPLWPVFGEYQFVPPQRWLHNIEHGAIVLLYHPCAQPTEIAKLKKLVKKCLWKYVITPWNLLSRDMPFALVAWRCRLQMARVDSGIVKYFIRSKAFKGPEAHYLKQGQYSAGLLEASETPINSDLDKVLC